MLHDVVLHHLLLDLSLGPDGIGGDQGLSFYIQRLTADHGWMGEPVARTKFWGGYGETPPFALPAHRTLLRRQRGVLVHSRWAAETVRRDNPGVRVRAIPMGVPLPPRVDPGAGRVFRRRHDIPEEAPVIGCFGFQTPIKRTLSTVAALARSELRRSALADTRLLIVGEVSEALDLETELRRAGVAERVHVTGYVDFEEFAAALGAADVAVNLRYPTAGETSASLLRILAAGLPAVVSDYAQFAELPEAPVAKVPLGRTSAEEGLEKGEVETSEVEALATVLAELLTDRQRLAAMGEAAREHVRRPHDPAAAADAVVEACREWARVEPPGDAPLAVSPPTTLAWSRLPGRLEVQGLDGWRPGERRRLSIHLANDGPATWLAGDSGPGGVALEVRLFAERGIEARRGRADGAGVARVEPEAPQRRRARAVEPPGRPAARGRLRLPVSRRPSAQVLGERAQRVGRERLAVLPHRAGLERADDRLRCHQLQGDAVGSLGDASLVARRAALPPERGGIGGLLARGAARAQQEAQHHRERDAPPALRGARGVRPPGFSPRSPPPSAPTAIITRPTRPARLPARSAAMSPRIRGALTASSTASRPTTCSGSSSSRPTGTSSSWAARCRTRQATTCAGS